MRIYIIWNAKKILNVCILMYIFIFTDVYLCLCVTETEQKRKTNYINSHKKPNEHNYSKRHRCMYKCDQLYAKSQNK